MSRGRLATSRYATGALALAAAVVLFLLLHPHSAPGPTALQRRQAAFLARHEGDPRVQPCKHAFAATGMSPRDGGSGTWVVGGETFTDAQVSKLVVCMRTHLAGRLARPGQASLLRSTARTG